MGAFLETVDGSNVWMLQRREDLRFTPKARKAFRIRCKGFRENLQRDITGEPRVMRTIDLL